MYYMKLSYRKSMQRSFILFLILFIIYINSSFATIYTIYSDSSKANRNKEFSIKSWYQIDSRGITNRTLYQYLNGAYFSKEEVNELNRNLKQSNVLGQDIGFLVEARVSKEKYYKVQYGFRSHFDAKASDQLLGLASRGNAPYAGKNLDKLSLLFHSVSWHKIGWTIGLGKSKKSYEPPLQISLNYLSGVHYNYINVSNMQLYTQQYGEYMNVRWNADYRSSTSNNIVGNAMGAGVDVKYIKQIRKIYIQAEIDDLGFMAWNRNNKNLSWDSNFRFSGLDMRNVTQVTNKNYADSLSDSFKNILNSHYNSTKNSALLPAFFHIRFSKDYTYANRSYLTFVNIDYMFLASYKPQITFGVESSLLKSKHMMIPQIRLGGYGDFNVDFIYVFGRKENKFNLYIRLNSLEAIVVPRYQSGAGLVLQFKYRI